MKRLVAIFTIALIGCNQPASESNSLAAPEITRFSKMNVNLYPVTQTVCDPLGGTARVASNSGLKAELFYINGTPTSTITKIQDVINSGEKAPVDIFLGDLIVPTRRFELGFTNQLGQTLQTPSGSTLIEWFALRMKTVLHLRPDQPEGKYEFASLSDDGSLLRIRGDSGSYTTVVDNDGTHPTRLACGTQTFDFQRDTEKLAQVLYHQGPRYHISVMMLMRRISASGPIPEPACGLAGNMTWFDYQNGSQPQQAFKDLLARGWEPLTAENYSLPNDAMFNPCMNGTSAQISNVSLAQTTPSSLTLTWETDIPATSQVSFAQADSSQWNISTSDNVLRTRHEVTVGGLVPQKTYALRAVSISDTYGKKISSTVYGTTLK